MNDGQGAKQQIVEQIKQNANILITVSTSPSVDELTAALGLTMMLNRLKKHATAVVSGNLPRAIDFLEPGKTFEHTVDSLRDFIIALDKEKADHLRYKVEGDVVRIFITPYRTTLSDSDLEFTQGDYNVELVIALGVKSQEHLDKALEAHGRILHDATVATISCDTPSQLGSIDWHEPGASSIAEMLVSLSEALKGDSPLLDERVATALLTGIVASTDRFSNDKTSSKVMTMAAQLMAAGANQQLIAAKLEAAHEISSATTTEDRTEVNRDGTTSLEEGASSKVSREDSDKKKKKPAKKRDDDGSVGGLAISHEREGTIDEVAREVARDNQMEAAEHAETVLAQQLESVAVVPAPVQVTESDLDAAKSEKEEAMPPMPELPSVEPILGGTLNATADQAAADKRREEELDRNKTILSHKAPIRVEPPVATPTGAIGESASIPSFMPETAPTAVAGPLAPLTTQPTLADIDAAHRSSDTHSDAMAAVHAAFDAPAESAVQSPQSLPQPVFEAPAFEPMSAPAGLPPLPDFSAAPLPPPIPPAPFGGPMVLPSLPPQQPEQLGQLFGEVPPSPVPAPAPADPGQFRIPGQG